MASPYIVREIYELNGGDEGLVTDYALMMSVIFMSRDVLSRSASARR